MNVKGTTLKFLGAAAMATAMLAATTQPAHAAMLLTLDDGIVADFKSITDGGVLDSNGAAGAITYIGAVGGNWWLNVTTGVSFTNTSQDARIDLNTVNLSYGAGNLTMTLFDNGFSLGSYPATVNSALGGTLCCGGTAAGSTVNFTSFVQGNPLPAFSAGIGAYSNTSSTLFAGPSTFSLMIQDTIHATGATSTSFDHELDASVPEPASMLLLGTGLLALARRRRAKKA